MDAQGRQNTVAIFQQIRGIYSARGVGIAKRIYNLLKMIDRNNNSLQDTIGFLIEDAKKDRASAIATVEIFANILAATNVDADDQQEAGEIRNYFMNLLTGPISKTKPQEKVFEDLFRNFYNKVKPIDESSIENLKIIFAQLHQFFNGKKEPETIATYEEFFGLVGAIESEYDVANSSVQSFYSRANDLFAEAATAASAAAATAAAARADSPSSPPPPPLAPRLESLSLTARKGILPTPQEAIDLPPPPLPPKPATNSAQDGAAASSNASPRIRRSTTHETVAAPIVNRAGKFFINLANKSVAQLLEIFEQSENCTDQPNVLKKILTLLSEREDTRGIILHEEKRDGEFTVDLFSNSVGAELANFKTDKAGTTTIDFFGFFPTVQDIKLELAQLLKDHLQEKEGAYIEIERQINPRREGVYIEVNQDFHSQYMLVEAAASASPMVRGRNGSGRPVVTESDYVTIAGSDSDEDKRSSGRSSGRASGRG